jgi:hypothetical protein
MRNLVILFGMLLLLSSCSEDEKKPPYILEEAKFVEALTEMQIAESIIRLGYHRSADSTYTNDSIYAAAFNQVNVSASDFDSTLTYYLERPKELEKMYDLVLERISTRTAEFKAKQKVPEEDPVRLEEESLDYE